MNRPRRPRRAVGRSSQRNLRQARKQVRNNFFRRPENVAGTPCATSVLTGLAVCKRGFGWRRRGGVLRHAGWELVRAWGLIVVEVAWGSKRCGSFLRSRFLRDFAFKFVVADIAPYYKKGVTAA